MVTILWSRLDNESVVESWKTLNVNPKFQDPVWNSFKIDISEIRTSLKRTQKWYI